MALWFRLVLSRSFQINPAKASGSFPAGNFFLHLLSDVVLPKPAPLQGKII
jgi:hypothetical protein